MTSEKIFDIINEYYNNNDIIGLLKVLEEEWQKLENPKEEQEASYHIASFIIDFSIQEEHFEKAEKWGKIIQTCDLERHDSGHREFLYAKTKYHLKKYDEAKELMNIAFKKSRGRCFENQNKEYKDFFDKI